jgi:hypothetical protein
MEKMEMILSKKKELPGAATKDFKLNGIFEFSAQGLKTVRYILVKFQK